MGFRPGDGMMVPLQSVRHSWRTVMCLLTAVLLAGGLPFRGEAKSYSSGGHSYSSHSSHSSSSHSSSFHSSHSFSSGASHSFSSGTSRSSGGTTTRSSGGGGSGGHSKTFTSGG